MNMRWVMEFVKLDFRACAAGGNLVKLSKSSRGWLWQRKTAIWCGYKINNIWSSAQNL